MHDYLIIGAGLAGAVAARQLTDAGKSCLVIERRDHLGGLCYTQEQEGLPIHCYGAHIFHTASPMVWEFMTRWGALAPYRHRLYARTGARLWSFPINLQTLHQLWGITTPQEAQAKLASVREPIPEPANLEDWCLAHLGRELYELFIRGYTKKQWQCNPRQLPAAIIQRLPVRLTWNDAYFDDFFQGLPVHGYTPLFEKLLEGIPVELGVDYRRQRPRLDRRARRVIFTGRIDDYFDNCYGPLAYRGLMFVTQPEAVPDFQGCGVVNYPEEAVPFTRIVEHQHLNSAMLRPRPHTWLTTEYPSGDPEAEACYPLPDEANLALYHQYHALAASQTRVRFAGRLGTYRYLNMDQVVAASLELVDQELGRMTPLGLPAPVWPHTLVKETL